MLMKLTTGLVRDTHKVLSLVESGFAFGGKFARSLKKVTCISQGSDSENFLFGITERSV